MDALEQELPKGTYRIFQDGTKGVGGNTHPTTSSSEKLGKRLLDCTQNIYSGVYLKLGMQLAATVSTTVIKKKSMVASKAN